MKNTVKWIIITVVLVAVVFGASVIYDNLSGQYADDSLPVQETETVIEKEEPEKTENNDYFSAPDFTVYDENGKEYKLSDFKGKPVVLNFWATWCHFCKEGMPDFNTAYKNHPDVQFLMINATDGIQETVSVAKEYVEEKGYEFDVYYDTEQTAVFSYRVTGFPATFFIDKDGNLVTGRSGLMNSEMLEMYISLITDD